MSEQDREYNGLEVAIIGMAGRFPGAPDLERFWSNLANGVESITRFTPEELAGAGVPAEVAAGPDYVPARAILDDVEWFDAPFFGMYAREAETLDPQQRLFLECGWEALEEAGYDASRYPGLIGVFGGIAMNTYLYEHLLGDVGGIGDAGASAAELYRLAIGNDKDFLASRLAYKLNLTGPSVVVQSACSTSLVAVHIACQSLQSFNCDIALAGGVAVSFPQRRGYRYQEGMILSPDGHCRAFDADAAGTVGGDGAAIVVLKRLAEALEDGDNVHAVIKGSAINNDGAVRAGYTAPSARGQARAIALAQAVADVPPDTIAYIEAHGTGTAIGDPIEIEALDQVFRAKTDRKGFCALGSLKSNVGHLDTAAGAAGLIKTVLALRHARIPPSLNFRRPNPRIPFDRTAFYVNDRVADWPRGPTPRRAGVSSFGIGGTNAHVVVEEAPPAPAPAASRETQLLLLSARTPAALDDAAERLARYLDRHPDCVLPDVAFTLQCGRRAFAHRLALTCRGAADAREGLLAGRVSSGEAAERPDIVFLFPGQGTQHAGMAAELHRLEPAFKEPLERCAELLRPHVDFDLIDALYGELRGGRPDPMQTRVAQPALFAVEYSLAQMFARWGIAPGAMLGHSLGEYVAACLAGVLTLEDALAVVAERGRLMQQMPPGAMLAVAAGETDVRPLLGDDLALAAVNAAASCVAAGPVAGIAKLAERLAERGIGARPLKTSHAFHSASTEPVLDRFTRFVERFALRPPRIPYVSNVSGTWITDEEATDPAYYARQMRGTVLFASGLEATASARAPVWLELGPGDTLTRLARRHLGADRGIVPSLPSPGAAGGDVETALDALGRLWIAGAEVDWSGFYGGERRRRVSLPTYPFQRERYAPPRRGAGPVAAARADRGDWLLLPSWKRVDRPTSAPAAAGSRWLLFADQLGIAARLARRLRAAGARYAAVTPGARFEASAEPAFTVDPRSLEDHVRLLGHLRDRDLLPDTIVHAWNVGSVLHDFAAGQSGSDPLTLGFYSVLRAAQAAAGMAPTPCRLHVLTTGVHDVTGTEPLSPHKALAAGPCRVAGQEHSHLRARHVDIALDGAPDEQLITNLLAELTDGAPEAAVALRGRGRWVPSFERLPLGTPAAAGAPLRAGGRYLIVGGLGRIGLTLAERIARHPGTTIVLAGRSELPPRSRWPEIADAGEASPLAGKLRALLALEKAGADVRLRNVDAADAGGMDALVASLTHELGRIDGIIHCAGVVGPEALRPLAGVDEAAAEMQFAAKVRGALNLAAATSRTDVGFVALQSSLSSVLGGAGFAAYAAANAFLDTFAAAQHREGGTRWVSIDWDGWSSGGDAEAESLLAQRLGRQPIRPEDGAALFEQIICRCNYPRVVVSTAPLSGASAAAPAAAAPHAASAGAPARGSRDSETRARGSGSGARAARHARAKISTQYAAPQSALQRELAASFERLLGLAPIGIHDSFFELGGDSLLATQLASELRDTYGAHFPLEALFSNPTIAGAEQAILSARSDEPDLSSLLQQVKEMTEDEAEAMLLRTRAVTEAGSAD
ncbi:MAG: SDR family NAD(P)-dependent oxidoreductase [Gammaproteobacteria bacterium]|nr:SDR family NAD(P)-dependent oxidoreductase [Gammaproteobacteria bacterium]